MILKYIKYVCIYTLQIVQIRTYFLFYIKCWQNKYLTDSSWLLTRIAVIWSNNLGVKWKRTENIKF